jgi:hypothetical protein
MIILGNNPLCPIPVPDDIQIITEAAFATLPLVGVTWYCSWNYIQGCSGAPYRNNGVASFPVAFVLNPPISMVSVAFPPSLTPPQLLEITEITINNPLTVAGGQGPVNVYIDFFNGATGISSRIMRCSLGLGQTLTYKATPGNNGIWLSYDTRGHIVNS